MDNKPVSVPAWVKDAVFYQIFPERFENGDPTNDPPNSEPWGNKPKGNNYFGGDLQGIINRLGHLKRLGVNALYLNPIFAANSNHKYNTTDYSIIDPAFGTNEVFDRLVRECKASGIRIVIDGVFNHVGTAHFAFKDVKEKGKDSPYASWFNIYSFPVSSPAKPNYECWWGYGSLPKLMVQNPEVKKYLFEVTRYWTERVDGWRLDVANEVPHDFWKEFRTLSLSINPECYIVGEIWEDAAPWLKGDEFDAVMNYRFRAACLEYFAEEKITASEFDRRLEILRNTHHPEMTMAMMNLLDSHDTERYLTLCNGDLWKVKLSVILQMTYVGAPMFYYGDEIGMEGGKDPDCRRTMMWDEKEWNMELFDLYRKLIALRSSTPALRSGRFATLTADDSTELFAFERRSDGQTATVILNRSVKTRSLTISVDSELQSLKDELTNQSYKPVKGSLTVNLPGHSARIFIHTFQKGKQ